MASKQRDREEFISIMAREVPSMPLAMVRQLMRYSATLHRLAELECSSEAADRDRVRCPSQYQTVDGCLCRDYGNFDHDTGTHGSVPRIVQGERIGRLVTNLATRYGLSARLNGDPRGAVVKLAVPSGYTNDWGREGVCVP
jgi:hypothetical protein